MNFVFLGPPGAGKGTQADYLSEAMDIEHISTGELLREEIARRTPLGVKAKDYVESGALVPDDIVIDIIKEHFSEKEDHGFILDGFPRNKAQAVSMDEHGVSVKKVFFFDVDKEVIINRLSGRLYCPVCKKFFHSEYRPPAKAGVCDFCGGTLTTRADDEPESVENRLKIYLDQTHPLIEYYEEKGILIRIDANRPVDAIRTELKEKISS